MSDNFLLQGAETVVAKIGLESMQHN
jgi:hypothetical protein